jgi:hypothetical protein
VFRPRWSLPLYNGWFSLDLRISGTESNGGRRGPLGWHRYTLRVSCARKVFAYTAQPVRPDPGGIPIPRHPEAARIKEPTSCGNNLNPGWTSCSGFVFVGTSSSADVQCRFCRFDLFTTFNIRKIGNPDGEHWERPAKTSWMSEGNHST